MYHSMQIYDIDDDEFFRRFGFARCKPHTVARWMQTDDERQWRDSQANPETREKLRVSGWTDHSIEYRYNNYGFRSYDDYHLINPKAGPMFLGCSITEGIGLNIEQTWAHRMSRIIGGRFYNLGQAAAGIEAQYRLLRAWAPALRPTAIFTLGAIGPRREILSDDGSHMVVGPWRTARHEPWLNADPDEFERTEVALMSRMDQDVSTERALDAIKHVTIRLGIPLYMPLARTAERAKQHGFPTEQFARDGMHHGVGYHEVLSRGLDDWQRVA